MNEFVAEYAVAKRATSGSIGERSPGWQLFDAHQIGLDTGQDDAPCIISGPGARGECDPRVRTIRWECRKTARQRRVPKVRESVCEERGEERREIEQCRSEK